MPTLTSSIQNRNSAADQGISASPQVHQWMMKPVAFMATTKHLGGLERLSVRLATQLISHGADVRYICRPGSPLSELCDETDIDFHSLHVSNSADLGSAIQLANYLVTNDIGILHVHSRRDFVPAVIAVKIAAAKTKSRPKLVLHVHQVRRLGDGGKYADAFFDWGADKVIAVSQAVKREICHGANFKDNFVEVLINGISMDDYPVMPSSVILEQRMQMRHRWGVEQHVPLVGMVGRLDQKGQLFVTRAIPTILEKIPNAHFVFIGPQGIPKVLDQIRMTAAAAGVLDRVIIAGPIADMPSAYASIDTFVHLPMDEAFGLAMAEAMASNIPVISSDIGGCSELVAHMVTGMLIAPRDNEQLVDAVVQMLGPNSRAFRSKIAAAGRESVEKHFTLDRQVNELMAVYDRIL